MISIYKMYIMVDLFLLIIIHNTKVDLPSRILIISKVLIYSFLGHDWVLHRKKKISWIWQPAFSWRLENFLICSNVFWLVCVCPYTYHYYGIFYLQHRSVSPPPHPTAKTELCAVPLDPSENCVSNSKICFTLSHQ